MSERDEGFRKELACLINRYSRENGSDTPDFILADYLDGCLRVFDGVLQRRETWYGRKSPFPTEVGALASPAAAPAAEPDQVSRILGRGHVENPREGEPGDTETYSEPAAPEPDLRCEACGDRLADEDAMHAHDRTWHGAAEAELLDRISELEAALRELTRAATEHANAHGCSGDLGARLSDAKALLAARTSPRGAGEGT